MPATDGVCLSLKCVEMCLGAGICISNLCGHTSSLWIYMLPIFLRMLVWRSAQSTSRPDTITTGCCIYSWCDATARNTHICYAYILSDLLWFTQINYRSNAIITHTHTAYAISVPDVDIAMLWIFLHLSHLNSHKDRWKIESLLAVLLPFTLALYSPNTA